LREFAWSFERDGYQANDLIMLSEHLGDAEFRQIAIQRNPENVVWVVTARGDLLSLTYERGQNVAGWARHVTRGLVESVAVVPGGGEDDEIWLVVNRTFNGESKRYVEWIEPNQLRTIKSGEKKNLIFCDCAVKRTFSQFNMRVFVYGSWRELAYTGMDGQGKGTWELVDGATTYKLYFSQGFSGDQWNFEITGDPWPISYGLIFDETNNHEWPASEWPHKAAWSAELRVEAVWQDVPWLEHLEGETVSILADGIPHPALTVTGGVVTLARPAKTVIVGLPYEMIIEPTWFETMDPQSVSKQGVKRLLRASVQFYESLGCQLSDDDGVNWVTIPFSTLEDPLGLAPSLYTGTKDVQLNSGSRPEISIILKQTQPLPLNVMSVGAKYSVEMP
jgi:hypothetical protein